MKLFIFAFIFALCSNLLFADTVVKNKKETIMLGNFFECDITPPYGTERPGGFNKVIIKKICDPLKVRVLALSNGSKKVAIISFDNIGVGPEFLKRLKAAFPDIFILSNSSHTHYGGNLRDKVDLTNADPIAKRLFLEESAYHDSLYYEFSLRQSITAITAAFENLQEVDFSFGKGRVENLIFNRRTRMKDGTAKTHAGKGNPNAIAYAGPVDDELGVMGVWKKGTDQLLGFALNFSCHACINLEGVTADFCGVAINTVKGVYGKDTGAVYINGASGDVTQIDNLSLKLDTGRPIAVKLGRAVGGEAIKILATADKGEIKDLNFVSQTYIAKCKPRRQINKKSLEKAYEVMKNNTDKNSSEYKKAKSLIKTAFLQKAKNYNKPYPMELSALQIGPLVIGSTPGEMFAQFALNFKKASKHPFSWFSQLSFGLCYIPTADAYDKKTGGGYEVVSAKFVAPTGHEMTDILINLVNQFTPSAVPPPQTVPAVNKIWDANAR